MTNLFRNKYLIPSTRLAGYDYCQSGYYFITICAKNRLCYFGDIVGDEMVLNDMGKIILNELLKTPQMRPNVELDEYIIMPNHIHVIIIIVETHCNASLRTINNEPYQNKFGPQRNNLSSIVRGFKSATTKIINEKHDYGYFAWQPRFYDHIIRNETSFHNIQQYIINNPLTWDRDRNNPEGLIM